MNESDLLDDSQRDVIEAASNRMAVIAPAGYGKTFTMVAKLVNDIKNNALPNFTKALAITFSVNAARKMQNDLDRAFIDDSISKNKVWVCNYHSLARRIVKLYACSVLNWNIDIDSLNPYDEKEALELLNEESISKEQRDELAGFQKLLNQADACQLISHLELYCDAVYKCLIPQKMITYNAILAFALLIFQRSSAVVLNYQRVFPYIIVDEVQDTNILCFELLKYIIGSDSQMIIFGDPYQRIYGFNGAIPNMLDVAEEKFGLEIKELHYSHRFSENSKLFALDRNLRQALSNSKRQDNKQLVQIPYSLTSSIEDEVDTVYKTIKKILSQDNESKIAVLVRQRGCFTNLLTYKFEEKKLEYFNNLFKLDSEEFIRFNNQCLNILHKSNYEEKGLSKKSFERFIGDAITETSQCNFEYSESYCQLLLAFQKQIIDDYKYSSSYDIYKIVNDVFTNRSLQHAIEHLNQRVLLSTIYTAKGLEWDYVLLPEMMQLVLPTHATCQECFNTRTNKVECNKCIALWRNKPSHFDDDLCLFYVAITRAKKEVICFGTTDRVNSKGEHKKGLMSCLLTYDGIEPVQFTLDQI